jgi:hypothetical protein
VAAVSGGYEITGADDVGAFSGVLPAGGGLHFLHAGVDASAPQVVPVIQATTGTGAALGSGENLDAHPGLPLAVEVQGDILVFKGTLSGPARAVYVPEDTRTGKRWLALRLDTHAASLTDLGFAPAAVTAGSYDAETHLFSTPHGSGSLPEYVHAADPEVSHAHWRLPLPEGMDLPPSFIVRGQPWWFAGWDDSPNANVATYRGFYDGQIMSVDHAMQDPAAPVDRLVTLVDPVHNAGLTNPFQETQGTLSDVRRSVRLRDGTLVLSGNALGGQETVTPTDDYSLHTIRSDVDIIGNNLSFGVLQDDASLAGALFSFADQGGGGRAALHQVLARDRAEWVWWKAVAANGMTDWHPVMMVDENHVLRLYPRTPAEFPSIILNPEGTSSFKGPVRVPRGGDIPMGIYRAGGEP